MIKIIIISNMLKDLIFKSLFETLKIGSIILVLMIALEYIEIKYNKRLKKFFSKNRFIKISFSSLFGIIPGCIGTFAVDSLYMSGIIGFGAINSVLIATSGDEAFAIIGMAFTQGSKITVSTLILLFSTLFILGIIGGYLALLYKKIFKISLCTKCTIIHKEEEKENRPDLNHFVKEHIINHIIKKHFISLLMWLFVSILFISSLDTVFNMQKILTHNKSILLLLGAFVGILPVSGPNLLFVTLFSQGMIPFSVLLTNSIVQDGHGSLPLLSFSVTDTIKIKMFNLLFGLTTGIILMILGF